MRRIAKGIMRYVVNAANPFIVGAGGPAYSGKPVPADQPFGTLTTENHRAVVMPALVQTGYGERDGQAPRALDIERPLGTIVSGGKHALVSAFLNEHANASTQRVFAAGEPMRTICGQVKGGHFGLVSATLEQANDVGVAFLAKHYTGVVGSELADPIGTVTSTDHHSLVLAHVQRDMGRSVGHAADVPLATTTAGGGGKSAVVASTLVKLRGTSSTAPVDQPLHTVSAGGQHHAEVRAFLVKYYGADQDPRLEEPLHTVTTKDRFGLVTIQGVDYEIVDIGLRMLARERCPHCDGAGDVHRPDGTWAGTCTCAAGTAQADSEGGHHE